MRIRQLANPELTNRDPQISETGLIVWTSYAEGIPEEGGGASINFFHNGTTGTVTKAAGTGLSHGKPIAFEDTVLWHGTRTNSNRAVTWVLREVPDDRRDIPYKELPALYRSQLPLGVAGTGLNMHLNPDYQLFSGPHSNEVDFLNSAQPGLYSIPTNLLDKAVTDLNDPRELAANPYSLAITNKPNTNVVVSVQTNNLARRNASGLHEIYTWSEEQGIKQISHDGRNDFAPSGNSSFMAWQKAKYFPFGWEIMVLDGEERTQLTTNYYYDMAPQVYNRQVVWYGWDGNDYEVYLYDADLKKITQVTSNDYDDVSPVIWDGMIAWEGYAGSEADIFLYQEGLIKQLSENYEDDINPRIWNGQVVWQGYDGDDFEIYYFNGNTSTKLTTNDHDDIQPDIRDGVITWMGYAESWDAEIYYSRDGQTINQLTDNDYEDRNPVTSQGKIVWQADNYEQSLIFLAEP